MHKTLLLLWAGLQVFRFAATAQDPLAAQDLQSRAYLALIEGDEHLKKEDAAKALDCYASALRMYREIHSLDPNYNPRIIQFRLSYCDNKVKELETRLKKERGLTSAEAYAQLEDLKLRLAAMDSDTAILRAKLADTEARAVRAEEQVKTGLERLQVSESEALAAAEALRRATGAHEEAARASDARIAGLTQELAGVKAELDRLGQEKARDAEAKSQMEGRLEKLLEDTRVLGEQAQMARQQSETARQAGDAFLRQIADLEASARLAREKLEALEAEKKAGESRRQEMQATLEAFRADATLANKAYEEASGRLRDLEGRMAEEIGKRTEEAVRGARELERRLAEAEAARDAAVREAGEAAQRQTADAERLAALERDATNAVAAIETARVELQSMRDQVRKASDESVALLRERDALREEKESILKMSGDLEGVIAEHARQMAELRATLEAAHTERLAAHAKESAEGLRVRDEEIAALKKKVEDADAAHAKALADLGATAEAARLAALKAQQDQAAAESLARNQEIATLRQELARRVAEHDAALTNAVEQAALAARVEREALDQKAAEVLKGREGEIATLKKQLEAEAAARARELAEFSAKAEAAHQAEREALDQKAAAALAARDQQLKALQEELAKGKAGFEAALAAVLEKTNSAHRAETAALVKQHEEAVRKLGEEAALLRAGMEKQGADSARALADLKASQDAALQQEVARQAKQAGEALAAREREIESLRKGLQEAQAALAKSAGDLDQLRSTTRNLEASAADKLEKLGAEVLAGRRQMQSAVLVEKELRALHDALRAKHAELEGAKAAVEGELGKSRERENALQERLRAAGEAEAGFKAKAAEAEALGRKMEGVEQALKTALQDKEKLAGTLAEKTAAAEAADREVARLQAELRDRTEQLKRLSEKARQFMSGVEEAPAPKSP